jgi:hypothetical protein
MVMGEAVASGEEYRVGYLLSRPATVSMTVFAGRRRVTAARLSVDAGPGALAARASFRPGPYRVQIESQRDNGAITRTDRWAFLGGRLPASWAHAAAIEAGSYYGDQVGRCRPFGKQRADCVIRGRRSARCLRVETLRLTSTGDLLVGEYRCGSRSLFKAKPHMRGGRRPDPIEQYFWYLLPLASAADSL